MSNLSENSHTYPRTSDGVERQLHDVSSLESTGGRGNGHRPQGGCDGIVSTVVVTHTTSSDGIYLTAAGEIDRASAPRFAAELHDAIDIGDGQVVLDLGDVTFMDSSGVNALVTAYQSAPDRLRIGALHPAVRRVFEITALLEVFAPTDDISAP